MCLCQNIAIGFEIEYYPDYFDKVVENLKAHGGEYLILGQHFVVPENIQELGNYHQDDDEKRLTLYTLRIIEAMKTGKITYIAHPDILSFTGDNELYCNEMKKICMASKEYDIPLEINFLGIRAHRRYPNENFWRIAGKVGAPVTFGFDAHLPEDAADLASLETAEALVKKFDLNYIGRPVLRWL